MEKKVVFITSYYKGLRYFKRYLWNVRRVVNYLEAANWNVSIAVAVNDPSKRERSLWEKSCASIGAMDVSFCPRETVYASWNRLLRLHQDSDVFLIWNMDDIRYPSGALRQIEALRVDEARVVASAHQAIETRPPGGFFRWHKWRAAGNHNPTPFLAFNRQALKEVGPFDEAYRISGDKEWYYRAQSKGVRVELIEKSAGILYHANEGLSTSSNPYRICENLIVQELYPDFPTPYWDYYLKVKKELKQKGNDSLD